MPCRALHRFMMENNNNIREHDTVCVCDVMITENGQTVQQQSLIQFSPGIVIFVLSILLSASTPALSSSLANLFAAGGT